MQQSAVPPAPAAAALTPAALPDQPAACNVPSAVRPAAAAALLPPLLLHAPPAAPAVAAVWLLLLHPAWLLPPVPLLL